MDCERSKKLRDKDPEWFGLLDSHLWGIEGVIASLLRDTPGLDWDAVWPLVEHVTARAACFSEQSSE